MDSTKKVTFSHPRSEFSPENKELAEQKFLQWEGSTTRAKFSHKEEEVTEWIEQIVHRSLNARNPEQLANSISDGKILCMVVNALSPGSVREIPKKTIDRISTFLEQTYRIGVVKEQLFEVAELMYQKNMVKVVYCLHSLAEICHQRRLAPFFKGGRKERIQQKKEWKKKARNSTGKGFEGWIVKDSTLLRQIKDQPNEDIDAGAGAFISPIPKPRLSFTSPEDLRYIKTEPDDETTLTDRRPSYVHEEPIPIEDSDTSPNSSLEEEIQEPIFPQEERVSLQQKIQFIVEKWKETSKRFLLEGWSGDADEALVKLVAFWTVCIFIWSWSFFFNFKL